MVWIQIRTDILSVLIWVKTVCIGYQQNKKATASNERDKRLCTFVVEVLNFCRLFKLVSIRPRIPSLFSFFSDLWRSSAPRNVTIPPALKDRKVTGKYHILEISDAADEPPHP